MAAVRDPTGGGADYSFEAICKKATAELAYAMVRQGGTAVIIGMVPMGVKVELERSDFLSRSASKGA